jgi:hypothetical protein
MNQVLPPNLPCVCVIHVWMLAVPNVSFGLRSLKVSRQPGCKNAMCRMQHTLRKRLTELILPSAAGTFSTASRQSSSHSSRNLSVEWVVWFTQHTHTASAVLVSGIVLVWYGMVCTPLFEVRMPSYNVWSAVIYTTMREDRGQEKLAVPLSLPPSLSLAHRPSLCSLGTSRRFDGYKKALVE